MYYETSVYHEPAENHFKGGERIGEYGADCIVEHHIVEHHSAYSSMLNSNNSCTEKEDGN